jgi:actin-related protein 10
MASGAPSSIPPRRPTSIDDGAPIQRASSSSYSAGGGSHYRRHSLYGTEDRIIIDPGSKLWKVGFSGEGKPRQVYNVARPGEEPTIWNWKISSTAEEREEAERILAARMQQSLRAVFFEYVNTYHCFI